MAAALIFGGAPIEPNARLTARLARLDAPVVVAADGGAATALAFGFLPDVVIGDFDSLEPALLTRLRERGVPIETYPRDKDQTDGQLAIARAARFAPEALYLVGFLGGPRLDMTLGNVLLLARYTLAITLLDERNECLLLSAPATHRWHTEPGEIVSLLPLDGDTSIATDGLRWALAHEGLAFGDTRGLSNEPVSTVARVELSRGRVLLTRHFPQV